MARSCLFLLLLLGLSAAAAAAPQNFATGGATSGDRSAVSVADPNTAAVITSAGFQLLGVSQQLDLASATQFGVDPAQDVFVLLIGGNDYMFFAAEPRDVVGQIRDDLERMFDELGARRFVVFGLIEEAPPIIADPAMRSQLAAVFAEHNRLLAAELDEFRSARPGASVTPVDSAAVFRGLGPGQGFTQPLGATCVDPVAFTSTARVPRPAGGCDAFVFLDGIHLTSRAAGFFAQAAADALAAQQPGEARVRSLFTFGDSFLDTGHLRDTTERANVMLGNGRITSPNGPTYRDGRFCDGPNLLDQLERQLRVTERSSFFPQPLRLRIDASPTSGASEVAGMSAPGISGRLFVPRTIRAARTDRLTLMIDSTTCEYLASGPDAVELVGCSRGATAGDLIRFRSVLVQASRLDPLAIELLFHER